MHATATSPGESGTAGEKAPAATTGAKPRYNFLVLEGLSSYGKTARRRDREEVRKFIDEACAEHLNGDA